MVTTKQSPAAIVMDEKQQAIEKLQDELTKLKNSFKLLEQLQAINAEKSETRQRKLNEKLDKISERLDKLPIEVKLQMRFPRRIQGTLEEAVAELSAWTKVPMRFELGDLGEAGIPKIHEVELTGGDVSVAQLLGEALCQTNLHRVSSLADPQLIVVYVIQNAGHLGNESLLITSRTRAKSAESCQPRSLSKSDAGVVASSTSAAGSPRPGLPSNGAVRPRPAIRLSAAMSAMPLRVLTVALAMCGATTQFGKCKSGLSAAGGSGSVTSKTGRKDPALPQGLFQVFLHDQRPTSRVHEHCGRFHLAERRGIEHAPR